MRTSSVEVLIDLDRARPHGLLPEAAPALVLGYGNLGSTDIERGIQVLAQVTRL